MSGFFALALLLSAPISLAEQQTDKETTLDFRKFSESVMRVEAGQSVGTGFLFLDNRTVATCYHVVKGASRITVHGSKDAKWDVVSIRASESADIALLTLKKPSTRNVLRISKNQAKMGQRVYVIGNPLGFLTNSLSDGIVSAVRTTDGTRILQITAPISPGSSGSPVLDSTGDVIGMAGSTFPEGQSLNLAVPAAEVIDVSNRPAEGLPEFAKRTTKTEAPAQRSDALTAVSNLWDEICRAHLICTKTRQLQADKLDALQRLQTFWVGWEGSPVAQNYLQIVDASTRKAYRDRLDTYVTTLRRLLNADTELVEADKEARRQGWSPEAARVFQSARNGRLQRLFDADESFRELGETWRVWWSKRYINSVGAAAAFLLYAPPLRTTKPGSSNIYTELIPDPLWPGKCVLAERLMPEYDQSVLDRVFSILRNSRYGYEEAYDQVAIAQSGWTVYAIRALGASWVEVTDWRDLMSKLPVRRPGDESPSLEVLVGPYREAAKAIVIRVGI